MLSSLCHHTPKITIAIIASLFPSTYISAQLNDIEAKCACPSHIELITDKTLHGDVEVDGQVIGGASTLVPASTRFTFDTVFYHDNNRFYSANCLYRGLVQFNDPVKIGNEDYTEGLATLTGLGYAYAPVELSEILCSFASNDLPVGKTVFSSIGIGDSVSIIQYRYIEEDVICYGLDQITRQGEEIIENLRPFAYLRTCEEPSTEDYIINSTGDLGLEIADFTEHDICTTGDSILIDGVMRPECTLRAAIEFVNAKKSNSPLTFTFVIPEDVPTKLTRENQPSSKAWKNKDLSCLEEEKTGPMISPESSFPSIIYPIVLDASTQPSELVTISGQGLIIQAAQSRLKNLSFVFCETGVKIEGNGNYIFEDMAFICNSKAGMHQENGITSVIDSDFFGNRTAIQGKGEIIRLENCRIGFKNATGGSTEHGNEHGLRLNNFDSIVIEGSTISSNQNTGVEITDSKYVAINSSMTGTDPSGQLPAGNGANGITISTALEVEISGCVISKNILDGITISGSNEVRILNNRIGTDKDGMLPFGNGKSGIRISSSREIEINGNVISKNATGVFLNDGLGSMSIMNNKIGTDITGASQLGNTFGISIMSPFGRALTGSILIEGNVISDNQFGIAANGFATETDLLICMIINNKIGTTEQGGTLGNQQGIKINNMAGINLIRDNRISFNRIYGIVISNAGVMIFNNRIGPDPSGMQDEARQIYGIELVRCHGLVQENFIFTSRSIGLKVDGGNILIFKNEFFGSRFAPTVGINISSGVFHGIFQNEIFGHDIGVSISKVGVSIHRNRIKQNRLGLLLKDVVASDIVINKHNSLIGNSICENTVGINGDDYDLSVILNEICLNTGNNSGLHLTNSKMTITTNNFISDAGDAIFLDPNSNASISRNNFVDNQGSAINNQNTSESVPAANNWYGDASGPSGAGPGTGDGVSSNVDFQNWRMESVNLVGATLGDTIYVPTGDTITIPVYGQNWMDRDDQLNFSLSEEQNWSIFNPDQLTFLFIEDSLALEFPHQFIIPENPTVPENKVTVVVRSLNMPQQRDTVTFLLVAQERQLTNILLSPDSSFIEPGDTIDFFHTGFDQFGEVYGFQANWSAEGGTINSNGLYIAGDADGTFTVTLSSGSVSSQAIVVIEAGETTATELIPTQISHNLTLYPNPCHDQVTISYQTAGYHQVCFALYDLYGSQVYSQKEQRASGPQEVLCQIKDSNGNTLPTGIYIFQVYLGDKVYVGKLIRGK